MLFHCLHVKSKESLCYGFKCTFVQKKKSSVTHELKRPSLHCCTVFAVLLTANSLLGFDLTSSFVSV